MKELATQLLKEAEEQIPLMTAYINATNGNAADPARKAIVYRRKKLCKMLVHLKGLVSSLNEFD